MLRRLASVACVVGLLVVLLVTVLHQHVLTTATPDDTPATCAFCAGGGMAPAPKLALAPRVLAFLVQPLPAAPEPAPRKVVLPLSHSGNAPPRA